MAPPFEAFWARGGGLATFGPPISPPRTTGGRLRQTFLAVEMVQEEGERVRLAPLGWDLGLAEPAVPPFDGRTDGYDSETGHTVYAGFRELYERLGGREVVGGPISEVGFRGGQIIQFFENLAMYRAESASPAAARLVPLGLSYRPPAQAAAVVAESVILPGLIRERPFTSFVTEHGGETLFGQPLSAPYLAEDGALEQVYERAVLYSPDGSRRETALRPLGSELGPGSRAVPPSEESGAIFFEETGHNVLWAFADFYRAHDGQNLLGLPVEEAVLEDARMVQRFENGILTYDFDLPPALAVQLAPLGRGYLAAHPPPTAEVPASDLSSDRLPAEDGQELVVEAALGESVVDPGDGQTILVKVTRSDGAPVSGASVVLQLRSSEGTTEKTLAPTDKDGVTSGNWRLADAAAGEIVNVEARATRRAASGGVTLQYAYAYPPG